MFKINFKNKIYRQILLSLSVIFCVILIVSASYMGYLYIKADAAIQQISGPKASGFVENSIPPSDDALSTPTPPQRNADTITFMLTGIDTRAGSGGTLNSDVMMFAGLDLKTRSATVVSIPRDIHVTPEDIPSEKANFYYAYFRKHNRDAALAKTRQFYGDLLHVPLDHMIVVDFDGVRKLVDALGGLKIDVDMDMRYIDTSDGTNINLQKGLQTLNGKQTLDFVRYRKSNQGTAESSDIARNKRQQQVLSKILEKLTSLNGISHWGKVLDVVGQSFKTDIPESLLRSWIINFNKMKPENIDFIHVDGRWVSPYILPQESDLEEAFGALRSQIGLTEQTGIEWDDIMTLDKGNSSANRSPSHTTQPSTVTQSTYGRQSH